MDKTFVMNEITEILDVYCAGCFLKNQLAKEKGKTGCSSILYHNLYNWGTASILRTGNE